MALKREAALDTELADSGLLGQSPGLSGALRHLTAAHHFRSATVDELELEDDFFRRPVRPEDLSFLDFSAAIDPGTLGLLSSLTAQRILLTLYECSEGVLPPAAADHARWVAWRGFYDEDVRRAGEALLPALHRHALGFLGAFGADGDMPTLCRRALGDASHFWSDLSSVLKKTGYAEDGVRFLLVQTVPVWDSVQRAAGSVPLEIQLCFDKDSFRQAGIMLSRAAREAGLRGRRHRYWQFYLPGSLAVVNMLHALARQPVTCFEYAGARLIAEADRHALASALACAQAGDASAGDEEFLSGCVRAIAAIASRGDAAALRQMAAGASRMVALLGAVRRELASQIAWISDLSWSQQAAREIDARIRESGVAIDRDTFVEPREMCSTTHVHDDHRLVVIESGTMVFWGNIGMRHRMEAGDMILVPMSRLHGSSVLSPSCTYHQPIIPQAWRADIPAWREAPI